MKKILLLFILIFSVSLSQAQTLQNPTFGNTTTNTLKLKTPSTVTSVNFLPAFGADGITVNKIDPINLQISTATQNALNLKANDNAVMHLSGSETITGNKTFTGTVSVQNPTAATHAVTKSYADGLIVGLLNDRGSYNASSNLFPTTGGSGTSGAILKGDIWFVSVAGTLGGKAVSVGDSFRALANTPGQTAGNWSLLSSNLSYVPANDANVIHRTGGLNETADGIKTFDNLMLKIQPIGSNLYKLRQEMAFDDWWSIYGEGGSSEKGIMVFEVGDNGEPFSGLGQKFSFRYNANSSGVAKTVFEIDYNDIYSYNNILVGTSSNSGIGKVQINNGGYYAKTGMQTNTINTTNNSLTLDSADGRIHFGQLAGGIGYGNFIQSSTTADIVSTSVPLTINPFGGNTYINQDTGTAIVGAASADGVNKFIVAGTAKASPATSSDQLATLGQVNAGVRPYKVYTALVTQTGTSAPTATILENTLGGIVVLGYSSAGNYTATLAGAFVNGKTAGLTGNNLTTTQLRCSAYRIDNNTCGINSTTYLGVATDSALNGTLVELRVYN